MKSRNSAKRWTKFLGLLLIILVPYSCGYKENYKELGEGLAGPLAVGVSDDGKYFYALSTDMAREYDGGSILVITSDGEKRRAVPTQRMGRSLTIAGDNMIVAFNNELSFGAGTIKLYDLTTADTPVEKASWDIECSPMTVAMRKNYKHFFVSCFNGDIHVGTIENGAAGSELKHIRNYGLPRRAMYIDVKRELLFAFVTDMGAQGSNDSKLADSKSFTEAGEELSGPNEIPDELEKSKAARKRLTARYNYQFVVYDIAGEREAGFPRRSLTDPDDTVAARELRWLYFTLANADGAPDSEEGVSDLTVKNYRTNFYEARPSPVDDDIFYISHRGSNKSEHSNNIIKVTLLADPLATPEPNADGTCSPGHNLTAGVCIPKTPNIMSFERVYGFKGEVDELQFPSDFDVKMVNGQQLLVVNHFRDLKNWSKDKQRFSISAKVLDQGFWRSDLISPDYRKSYHQIAINGDGMALTCSFYGQSVILLKILPGSAIEEVKQIY